MKEQPLMRIHRLSHRLHGTPLRFLSRLIDVMIRIVFTAHIPGKAVIGQGCHFGHNALGVILNGRSLIGRDCFIGTHVVLGGQPDADGAPQLEDDVVVHTGARIFGRIVLGEGCVVAANAVVTQSFPPRTLIGGMPARALRSGIDSARYRPNAWRTATEAE